jgi:hypothetical protein
MNALPSTAGERVAACLPKPQRRRVSEALVSLVPARLGKAKSVGGWHEQERSQYRF